MIRHAIAILFALGATGGATALGDGGQPGARCFKNEDCAAGLFCYERRPGTCPGPEHAGACARRPPFCAENCEPLCGCDGQTYCNACLAHQAGVDVAHNGACDPGAALCRSDADCASGQFCETPPGACGKKGLCRARPQMCTEIFKPVCGCDHKTYSNECAAEGAGMSVATDGACPAAAKCSADKDCRGILPHICRVCSDGKTACAHFVCKAGQCLTEICP
jgi:hypothetical protein